MGDFEEVERLQAGIRAWLLQTARSGRHELRDIAAPAVLPLLCAAAFGPALADSMAQAGVARMGVLSSVGPTSWPVFLTMRLDAPSRRMGPGSLRQGTPSRT